MKHRILTTILATCAILLTISNVLASGYALMVKIIAIIGAILIFIYSCSHAFHTIVNSDLVTLSDYLNAYSLHIQHMMIHLQYRLATLCTGVDLSTIRQRRDALLSLRSFEPIHNVAKWLEASCVLCAASTISISIQLCQSRNLATLNLLFLFGCCFFVIAYDIASYSTTQSIDTFLSEDIPANTQMFLGNLATLAQILTHLLQIWCVKIDPYSETIPLSICDPSLKVQILFIEVRFSLLQAMAIVCAILFLPCYIRLREALRDLAECDVDASNIVPSQK